MLIQTPNPTHYFLEGDIQKTIATVEGQLRNAPILDTQWAQLVVMYRAAPTALFYVTQYPQRIHLLTSLDHPREGNEIDTMRVAFTLAGVRGVGIVDVRATVQWAMVAAPSGRVVGNRYAIHPLDGLEKTR